MERTVVPAARFGVLTVVAALVLAAPVLVPSVYTNLVSRAAVYGLVALSLNILLGYAGQVSLGHAAFLGVGAFASGYLLTEQSAPFAVGLAGAAATGAGAAVVLGAVALRLRGLYLALVTIAYGLFAQETIFNIRSLTRGGAGMPADRPALFSGDVAYAYLCMGVLAAAIAVDLRLAATRPGRAMVVLRENEQVAAAWGIDVARHKILAFTLSGMLAGVAGGLFASIEQIVSPQDFTFGLSLTFLLMTVVGGPGSPWGVVQGGVLFAVLPTLLDRAHANVHVPPFSWMDAQWEPAIAATLLLLTLVFFPGGIAQQQRALVAWLRGRPRGPRSASGAARRRTMSRAGA